MWGKLNAVDVPLCSYPRLKQRVAYMLPDQGNLAAVLETVRVCDTVLFLWSLQDFIDEDGEKLYSCLYAQGLPSVAHALMVISFTFHRLKFQLHCSSYLLSFKAFQAQLIVKYM